MISLERIAPEDWAAVERVRQTLQSLVIDTGGQSVGIRFGTQTLTWAGGTQLSNAPTVSHGLGRAPIAVFAQATNGLSAATWAVLVTFTYTSTVFSVQARTHDLSNPGAGTTVPVVWVAIG